MGYNFYIDGQNRYLRKKNAYHCKNTLVEIKYSMEKKLKKK